MLCGILYVKVSARNEFGCPSMSDLGYLAPIENWLSGHVIDPDLQGPIAKARAEFVGRSEQDVIALWGGLESVIDGWRASSGKALPTYRSKYRKELDKLVYEGPDRGAVKPDYLKIFQRLAGEKYPPLLLYVKSLDSNTRVGLLKVFAILILREAADGNPDGALKACALYDKLYTPLRPMVDKFLRIQKGRQIGGKKTAQSKKAEVAKDHQKILEEAKQLRDAGESRGEIVNVLAERHGLHPRSIRRILRDAGF